MSLQYLSGIGAAKKTKVQKIQAKTAKVQAKQQLKAAKQSAKTAKVQARGTTQQARAANVQNIVNKTAPVKILKAVQKQSPLAAQKIKKAAVAIKQRKVFKKAGEPLKVSQESLVEDKVYELPLTIEEGTQEVDEPEFFDDMDSEDIFEEDYSELGIIYPNFGAPKKTKKAAKKKAAKKAAPKKQVSPEKKAKRQEAFKKVSTQVMNVAKATLEAKGIKFPSKEQVQTEAETIQTEAKPKKSYTMPLIIGASALGLFLIFKKK